MNKTKVNYGKAIKDLRAEFGLTQKDLSERSGLSINYLSLVENEKRQISHKNIQILAKVFNVPDWIINCLAIDTSKGVNTKEKTILSNLNDLTKQAIKLYISPQKS